MPTESPPTQGDDREDRQPKADDRSRQSPSDDPTRQCDVVVEERDGQPNQCTIYSTAPGDPASTTWISASAGSYRSLEACR